MADRQRLNVCCYLVDRRVVMHCYYRISIEFYQKIKTLMLRDLLRVFILAAAHQMRTFSEVLNLIELDGK